MRVDVDVSEVIRLASDLSGAGAKGKREAVRAIRKAGEQMYSDARSNAQSYALTGEMASTLQKSGSGLDAVVTSPVRQGHFNEFGSYNIAPRAWLTQPQDRATQTLAEEMGRLGDLL